jgi:uncharacterized protein YydD (DUF2326 family)
VLDKKQRPEVGIQDIDKYEFCGLEIDSKLTNGYQLYIPYGIHCDIFDAIQDSIRLLYDKKNECKNNIKKLTEELNKLEEGKRDVIENIIVMEEDVIQKVNKDLKILEKIVPLVDKI